MPKVGLNKPSGGGDIAPLRSELGYKAWGIEGMWSVDRSIQADGRNRLEKAEADLC